MTEEEIDEDNEPAGEGELEEEEEGESEGDEEIPRVLVATMNDLGTHLPDGLRKSFGQRPIWFFRQDDEELVEIFEHLPEDPMPKGRAHELLRALRTFADETSDRLQEVLGVTDGIVYGFHGDASVDQVVEAFERDGFFVWSGVLKSGVLVIPES